MLDHKTRVTNNLTSSFYDSNVMNRPVKYELLVSCKQWTVFFYDYLKWDSIDDCQRLLLQIYVQRECSADNWRKTKKQQQLRVVRSCSKICLSIFNSTITNRIQSDKNEQDIFMTFHFDSLKCFELIHSNERMKYVTK